MRPDYRANLIHLHWCKSRYLLQHRMLGLTAEQKLLINTPTRMKGSGFLPARSDPKPVEVGTSSISSSGFGIRPAASAEPALLPKCKILFHWLCQFGVNTCVKELGGVGGFWGFFLNRGMISPLPAHGLCAKEEGAGDVFLRPSAPCCSIPAEGGCVHHRDP